MRRRRYRKDVEARTNDRLAVVNAVSSIPDIEKQIGAGQVEELILHVRARHRPPPVPTESSRVMRAATLRADRAFARL